MEENANALRRGEVPEVEVRYFTPASEVGVCGHVTVATLTALVEAGRHVRLQFEGWPAVQFVGWPSVAVGTFGGTVAFVDAQGDSQGRFRMVVVPDESSEPWPEARYLRQGVRANGWVLLDQVRMGYEIWRQLNGFPPSVREKPGSKS